jgi:hypothetical protein
MLDAANRDDGNDEEERDESHSLLQDKIRHRAALAATHLLRHLL